jgi:hypothetical protein
MESGRAPMVEISEMKVSLPMSESVKISTRPGSCLSRKEDPMLGVNVSLEA